MKTGETKLYYNGKANEPVELVSKVSGGWLVRLQNRMIVGPIRESIRILR